MILITPINVSLFKTSEVESRRRGGNLSKDEYQTDEERSINHEIKKINQLPIHARSHFIKTTDDHKNGTEYLLLLS